MTGRHNSRRTSLPTPGQRPRNSAWRRRTFHLNCEITLPGTSPLSRSFAFPTHWQHGFRVRQRRDQQLREILCCGKLKRNNRDVWLHQTCGCTWTHSKSLDSGSMASGRCKASKNELELALAHLPCLVVSPSQVIGKTVSVYVEDTTEDVWLQQASGVAPLTHHLERISSALLTFCCQKMQQIGKYVANEELR